MAFTDHTNVVTTDAWYDAVLPRSLKSTPAGEQRARLKRIEKRAAKAQERVKREESKYNTLLVKGKDIENKTISPVEADKDYKWGLASLKRSLKQYEPSPPAKQKKKKQDSNELTEEERKELQNELFDADPYTKAIERNLQKYKTEIKECERNFRDAVNYTEEVREKWKKKVARRDAEIAELKEGTGAKLLKKFGFPASADFADDINHLA